MIDIKKSIDLTRSKRLSYLLRHDKAYPFKSGGWRTLENLIQEHSFKKEEIVDLVEKDEKGRFELTADMTEIRALYGHSVPINLNLFPAQPPELLYHGTAKKYINDILEQGLLPKSRLYVHLSEIPEIALQTGARHGDPIVLTINAFRQALAGYEFYKIGTKTWLTTIVPIDYINF